jgi:hypothetical protein
MDLPNKQLTPFPVRDLIAAERLRDKVEGVASVISQHGDRIVRGTQDTGRVLPSRPPA